MNGTANMECQCNYTMAMISVGKYKMYNKKVLLRERKRHTVRRVASARYAALSNGGYPIQSWWGGTLVPPHHHQDLARGYSRYPTTTIQTWDGVPPIQTRDGVPLNQTLDGVPPTQTWDGVPPHPDLGQGTPLTQT